MVGKMGISGIALLLIFVGGLSQCGWLLAADSPSAPTLESLQQGRNTNILDPRSPPAQTTMELFYLILGIVVVIFLLVFIPLCLMLVRFRARKQDAGVEPPQIYGSNPIELAWTVGPAIIVFVLFLVTARSIFGSSITSTMASLPRMKCMCRLPQTVRHDPFISISNPPM